MSQELPFTDDKIDKSIKSSQEGSKLDLSGQGNNSFDPKGFNKG